MNIKFLIFLSVIMTSLNSFACMLKLDVDDKNGTPDINIGFSEKTTPFFSITLPSSDLGLNPYKSSWWLINETTGEELSPPTLISRNNKHLNHDLSQITLSTRDSKIIKNIIYTFKDSRLIISLGGSVRYLEVSKLCQLHPEKILNLDAYERGCK